MTRGARPTARDVAERAGVSVATVSHVVNGRSGRFGAETRARVLAAVEELGYAPDSAGRGLRRRRTDQICLVADGLGVPSSDRLARQLHDAADAAGYGVLTLLVDSPARADRAVDLLGRGLADGALIARADEYLSGDRLAGLASRGTALVVMDNRLDPEGFDVVRTPVAAACGEALDALLGPGRRRPAFLAHRGEADAPAAGRYRAYLDALERHGVPLDPRLVVEGADDRADSYWAVTGLLQRKERPDAVFAASDRAAIAAIWAVRDAGLSVPHDVAVLGIGNLREGLVTRPALSTVGPPDLDFTPVVGLLLDRLSAAEPPPGRIAELPWTFQRRGSL